MLPIEVSFVVNVFKLALLLLHDTAWMITVISVAILRSIGEMIPATTQLANPSGW